MMHDNESKTGPTGVFVAAFLVGLLAGGWFLFGSTSGASESAAHEAPERGANNLPSSLELERLQLENQLLAAELEKEKLKQQLTALNQQSVPTGLSNSAMRRPAAARQHSTTGPGESTLAYWNAINAIIDQEAKMRATPPGGVNDNNAAAFITARIAAGKFAVDAIKTLDTASVNRQVVDLAADLVQWYADGVSICQTGKTVLNSNAAARRGPAGLRWKASEFTHASAVNAINNNGKAVRDTISRQYGLDFPPLN